MHYLFHRAKLLPLDSLVKTSDVDHADWNYHPFLSIIQRLRFKIIIALLKHKKHYQRILEAGYGSGVFMPYLAALSDELYGIDPHEYNEKVEHSLSRNNISAKLFSGSITKLPFEDGYFEAVVIVSAIEYVDDIESACHEIVRVLKKNGVLIVVTPGCSKFVDIGLKLLTGESANKNYKSRRMKLQPALMKYFSVERKIEAPPVIHYLVRLYTGLCLIPK